MNPDITTVAIEQAGMGEALMFSHEQPPTDELALRRAIWLGMDRNVLQAHPRSYGCFPHLDTPLLAEALGLNATA